MENKVLLIEPNQLVRMLIRNGLKGYGIEFLEAPDGNTGLQLYQAHADEIRLVIGDVQLQGQNGIETLRQIRSINPLIPYIILTNVTHKAIVLECIRNGVNGFLAKPLHMVKLKQKVFELLDIDQPLPAHIIAQARPRPSASRLSDLQNLVLDLAEAAG